MYSDETWYIVRARVSTALSVTSNLSLMRFSYVENSRELKLLVNIAQEDSAGLPASFVIILERIGERTAKAGKG